MPSPCVYSLCLHVCTTVFVKVLTVLKLGSDLLDCPSIVYNAEISFWLRVRSEVKGFGTAVDFCRGLCLCRRKWACCYSYSALTCICSSSPSSMGQVRGILKLKSWSDDILCKHEKTAFNKNVQMIVWEKKLEFSVNVAAYFMMAALVVKNSPYYQTSTNHLPSP